MSNITANIKGIRDVMRKDTGVDGDAQRISQMVWMLFMKIFADKEDYCKELVIITTILYKYHEKFNNITLFLDAYGNPKNENEQNKIEGLFFLGKRRGFSRYYGTNK